MSIFSMNRVIYSSGNTIYTVVHRASHYKYYPGGSSGFSCAQNDTVQYDEDEGEYMEK